MFVSCPVMAECSHRAVLHHHEHPHPGKNQDFTKEHFSNFLPSCPLKPWWFPSPHNTTFPCTPHSPTHAVPVIFFPFSETHTFHAGSTKGIKLLLWVSEAQHPQSLHIYGGFQTAEVGLSCTRCAAVIFRRVLPEGFPLLLPEIVVQITLL